MNALPAITGQALRYATAGAIVAAVYIGGTLALSWGGLPIALAIALAYGVAVTLHFLLQRRFVFRNATFALSTRAQVIRYVAIGGVQYPLTTGGTKLLPELAGLSEETAYLCTVAVLSACGFLLLRHRVFHPIAGG